MSIAKITEFMSAISFMWYNSTKTIYFHTNMNCSVYKLAYFCNIMLFSPLCSSPSVTMWKRAFYFNSFDLIDLMKVFFNSCGL